MWRNGILGALSDEDRRTIIQRATRRAYPIGAEIFAQGEPGESMLLIETGFVQIVRTTLAGHRIHLGNLGAGAIVGELTLLDRAPRTADVVAKSSVTGFLLNFSDLRAFLVDHPEVMFGLMLDLSKKLRAANALVENRAMEDGASRLAHCLLDLAETFGVVGDEGEATINQRLSQSTLGQMASLSRESVNRRLRAWAQQGVLTADRDAIVIHQPDALAQIVVGDAT